MAHYAEIKDGKVARVLVADDEQWLTDVLGGTWIQTSYNTRGGVHYTDGQPSADQSKALRFNFAGQGYTYDADRDAFIPPKPTQGEWELDEATCLWVEVVEPAV